MRRTQAAKQQTHQTIVQKAGEQMRVAGVDGVGIAELMAQAGLTHGGFYAHFRNKDALVAEVCRDGMARTLERYQRATDAAPAGSELALVINTYLSAAQRDHPATSCLIPALAADVARSPQEVSTAFTEGLQNLLQYVGSLLPDQGGPQPPDEALVVVAGLVGSLLLARAANNPELRERLLQANRDFLTRTFAPESA